MTYRQGDAREDPAFGFTPFTMSMPLCDDDGIVRRGRFHHGTDYPCTGHAHYAGEHIRCTSPAHAKGREPLLLNWTRDGLSEKER